MSLTRPVTSRKISHLLLTGHNPFSPPSSSSSSSSPSSYRQSPSNPCLTRIPFKTWLSQIGREIDTFNGPLSYQINSISTSPSSHTLISYKNFKGIDRVLSLGRNESGQLGIGFCSQEGTRGLLEGFKGESILDLKTGNQSSWLLIKQDEKSNKLYSIGNLSRGKLGLPQLYSSSTTSEEEEEREPVMKVLPRATLVDTVELEEKSGKILQIESGFEHLLILTESGDLYGCGCNTDGQLSILPPRDVYSLTKIELPKEIVTQQGGIEKIVAGGDTSGLITKSGKLFTWGNSEYSQAGQGKKIDQILQPLIVPLPEETRIIDYKCGGSFGILLDGYGALGYLPTSPTTSSSSTDNNHYNPIPTLVPTLSSSTIGLTSPITRIRACSNYAVAISDKPTTSGGGGGGKLWSWGINSPFGRLGLGSISRDRDNNGEGSRGMKVEPFVIEPRELRIPFQELGIQQHNDEEEGGKCNWEIGIVELGSDGMWVEIKEEKEIL
ncbi:hypothetical protein JCM3765_000272 [Sporobolomyces pararoseus]